MTRKELKVQINLVKNSILYCESMIDELKIDEGDFGVTRQGYVRRKKEYESELHKLTLLLNSENEKQQ